MAVLPIKDPLASLDQTQSKMVDLAIKFGPRLLVAALIVMSGYYVGRWVGQMLDKMLLRFELDVTIRLLLVRIARLLVLVLFLIMALQNLGVDLLPLIAGLGVAGAGVALAMQGVLSNIAAGLTIIFTRPYRVGEYISIAGEEGRVEVISLFSTTLSHADLSLIVIPNRKIAGEILHNYGEIRQLKLNVGVAYTSDIQSALAAVHDVLNNNNRVMKDPEALVQVTALADSSIKIDLCPWVSVPDYPHAISELNQALLAAFQQHTIGIARPQHEVRMVENGS